MQSTSVSSVAMMELVSDKTNWDCLMDKAGLPDFHFSYDYHHIMRQGRDEPVLLHFSINGSGILIPLIIRDIPGTSFRDATSVYGYTGPFWYGELNEELIRGFQKSLKDTLEENKLVCVFSRLHPYIPEQHGILEGLGKRETLGKVVNIDLTIPLEAQWREVSSRYRTYINKERRTYLVTRAKNEADLRVFVGLYLDTMARLGANKMYFFKYEYFLKLWDNPHFDTTILLAKDPETNKIISGAMFISCGEVIQYHLSGTDADYLTLHPVKMLIDEMRLIGTSRGMKFFNLGGGLGGSEDSLFEFKSRFSNDYWDFNVWKFIVDLEAYIKIANLNGRGECLTDPHKCQNYFPCYRFKP